MPSLGSSSIRSCHASNLQAEALAKLQAGFPLLHFNPKDALLMQRRRCVACAQVCVRSTALQTPFGVWTLECTGQRLGPACLHAQQLHMPPGVA